MSPTRCAAEAGARRDEFVTTGRTRPHHINGESTVQAFSSFGHVNLKVNDIEASIDFYGKLGFPGIPAPDRRRRHGRGSPICGSPTRSASSSCPAATAAAPATKRSTGRQPSLPDHRGHRGDCRASREVGVPLTVAARSGPSAASTATADAGSPIRTATASRSWKWRRTASSTRRSPP